MACKSKAKHEVVTTVGGVEFGNHAGSTTPKNGKTLKEDGTGHNMEQRHFVWRAVQEAALGKASGGGDTKAIRWCDQSRWKFVTVPSFAIEDDQYEIPYGMPVYFARDARGCGGGKAPLVPPSLHLACFGAHLEFRQRRWNSHSTLMVSSEGRHSH
jgi:hypothetical protein